MTGEPQLSALVVAHNEAANLPDCLDSLRFCDEIVVVLDRCTDDSKAIAEAAGARTLEGAWPVEGDRRNAGNDACRGAWIFEVDADERVPEALAQEIRATVRASDADYHLVPFDNYIGGRLVRHGWGASFGVSSAPRLCRKGVKTWGRQRVHPALTWKDGARQGERLRARMVHYADASISDMLARLDRYTTARARDLRESGNLGSAARNYRRIVTRFWKCFVSRKGYREGGLGFLVAVCAGLYPILSYLKARYDETD
ncbi:glycosyltransferase family 2 protein [Ferruginivarius sediminum]|uniref:Glycosyltransferase family 2 protein n=1 Tax=Ferruginivarius sediminum TaxID=2661937 RepID=A0A369TE62_9PROT|nr:glycosyltransferase family 2 protein [Ferruginivarius sediminum]RDD63603.1 glycosyltransferase family 2 protein [Ferruginivarius sediminum]